MLAQRSASSTTDSSVTVCVKHTWHESRRAKLGRLLQSVRAHHAGVAILLAKRGREPSVPARRLERLRVEHVPLAAGAGLSAGRNALVRAARTPYVALMDDDLELLDGSALPSLLAALHADGDAVLAGGCYAPTPGATAPDCFNLRFDPSEDGSVVRARRVPRWTDGGCQRVAMTHNFFVGARRRCAASAGTRGRR